MTDFSSAAADYVTTRRAMGYKFAYQGQMVRQFAAYLDGVGAERLTIAHALSWAKQPANGAPGWWAVRLSTARGFARFLSALDPTTEVPSVGLLPEPSHRAVPYIYSDEDVARLRQAAGRLRPEHRADTYQTLIGLIAVTGMRVGESVGLDRDDVDLEQGLLTIRNSKFGKSRQLPLHPSTVDALAAYARRRDERRPKPKSPSFFTSAIGTRVLRTTCAPSSPALCARQGSLRRTGVVHRGYMTSDILLRSRRWSAGIETAWTSSGECRCCPPGWATRRHGTPTGICPPSPSYSS